MKSQMFTGCRGFWVQGSKVQGSAQPLAADVTSLIEKETLPLVSFMRGVN
jgi:hypothetical protein